ncbi:MAG: tetratricopeptide repeat protein, partial [Planctomycetota bacterium]
MLGKTSHKKWILVVLLLAVVGGLGYGGYKLVRRGMSKESLFRKAVRAYRRKDLEAAERAVRAELMANPTSTQARLLLGELLLGQERFDELEALAREWLERDDRAVPPYKMLVEAALRRGRLQRAAELAREMGDLDPAFSHRTLMRALLVSDRPQDREAAVGSALYFAVHTDSQVARAEAYRLAAEMMLDQSISYPADVRKTVRKQALDIQAEALKAVRAAGLTEGGGRLVRRLEARIQLLGDDSAENEVGKRILEGALKLATGTDQDDPDMDLVRTSLARAAMRAGEWDEAVVLIKSLRDDRGGWLQGVHRLIMRGRSAEPLELIAAHPFGSNLPARIRFWEAGLLLRGTEDDKERARVIIRELMTEPDLPDHLVVGMLKLLRTVGERDAAVALLAQAQEDRDSLWLDALRAASDTTTGAGQGRLADLAGKVDSFRQSLAVLAVLAQSGRGAVLAYLEEKVAAGGEMGARHRLLRALYKRNLMRKEKDAEKAEAFAAEAGADLIAIREQDGLPREVLFAALAVAAGLKQYETSGGLLARALSVSGSPQELVVTAYTHGQAEPSSEVRAALA